MSERKTLDAIANKRTGCKTWKELLKYWDKEYIDVVDTQMLIDFIERAVVLARQDTLREIEKTFLPLHSVSKNEDIIKVDRKKWEELSRGGKK
jgi:hypothetical protein